MRCQARPPPFHGGDVDGDFAGPGQQQVVNPFVLDEVAVDDREAGATAQLDEEDPHAGSFDDSGSGDELAEAPQPGMVSLPTNVLRRIPSHQQAYDRWWELWAAPAADRGVDPKAFAAQHSLSERQVQWTRAVGLTGLLDSPIPPAVRLARLANTNGERPLRNHRLDEPDHQLVVRLAQPTCATARPHQQGLNIRAAPAAAPRTGSPPLRVSMPQPTAGNPSADYRRTLACPQYARLAAAGTGHRPDRPGTARLAQRQTSPFAKHGAHNAPFFRFPFNHPVQDARTARPGCTPGGACC